MHIPVPIFLVAATLAALLCARFLSRWLPLPAEQDRFAAIDGLRGYLALFVFLHHANQWQGLVQTGTWTAPPSRLLEHMGRSSVALFFMVTAFLFVSRLLDRQRDIDWTRLLVSRFTRLVPLYAFAVCVLLVMVAVLSGGRLVEAPRTVATQVLHWIAFTAAGMPDINGVPNTLTLMAGVSWSLPYEWLFYFVLPAASLLIGRMPPVPHLLVASLCAGLMLAFADLRLNHALSFAGGILAAFLVRSDSFVEFARSRAASALALGLIGGAVTAFHGSHPVGRLLMVLAFLLIAGGCTLFGALRIQAARILGELSYGVYLLHGFVLSAAFLFLIGKTRAVELSLTGHWMIVIASVPVLVTVAAAAHLLIERPGMRATTALTARLRALGSRSTGRVAPTEFSAR